MRCNTKSLILMKITQNNDLYYFCSFLFVYPFGWSLCGANVLVQLHCLFWSWKIFGPSILSLAFFLSFHHEFLLIKPLNSKVIITCQYKTILLRFSNFELSAAMQLSKFSSSESVFVANVFQIESLNQKIHTAGLKAAAGFISFSRWPTAYVLHPALPSRLCERLRARGPPPDCTGESAVQLPAGRRGDS